MGAELLYGDLSIPETLPDILKDTTVIIDASTTRPTDILNMKQTDWEGKLALFQAAEVSQIDRFIFFFNKCREIPTCSINAIKE